MYLALRLLLLTLFFAYLSACSGSSSAPQDIDPPTAVNYPPVVDAGDDLSVTLTDTLTLEPVVSDDGYPEGSELSFQWLAPDCGALLHFADATSRATDITFSAEGTCTVQITVSDGELTATDSFTLTVNAEPVDPPEAFAPIHLHSRVDSVQPMTGIVLWSDSEHNSSEAIQLEYAYWGYNRIVSATGAYNWNALDQWLEQIAGRGHQAVLRFYFVYPGFVTTVPDSIKNA